MAKRKQRNAARRDKPTLAPSERLEVAAEIIASNAGLRNYTMTSRIIEALNCSRRSAQRYLARAREALAAQLGGRLADMAGSLPGQYADALCRARNAGDLKSETRLLAGIVDLTKALPTEKAPSDQAPGEIVFRVVNDAGRSQQPGQHDGRQI